MKKYLLIGILFALVSCSAFVGQLYMSPYRNVILKMENASHSLYRRDGHCPSDLQTICGRIATTLFMRPSVALLYGRYASVRTASSRPYETTGESYHNLAYLPYRHFDIDSYTVAVNDGNRPVDPTLINEQDWHIISGQGLGNTKAEAEQNAQNQFRRNLLISLSNMYKNNLGKYYQLYTDSKQNINKELVDELINSANQRTFRERGQYKCVMSIDDNYYPQAISQYLNKVRHTAQIDYNTQQHIKSMFIVDRAMLVPYYNIEWILDEYAKDLQELKTGYHDKYLIFQGAEQEIIINALFGMRSVVDFSYGGKTVIKETALNSYKVNLSVSFSSGNADFNIPSSVSEAEISFAYDIDKTFGVSDLYHREFLRAFINSFFTEKAGKISVLHISESRFFVTSTSFKKGESKVHDILRQKGWGVGNARNYTHRVVLSLVVSEEKMLNAGVYYIKAYAVVEIFDKQGVLVQSSKSAEVEGVDMTAEKCRAKVEDLLVGMIRF